MEWLALLAVLAPAGVSLIGPAFIKHYIDTRRYVHRRNPLQTVFSVSNTLRITNRFAGIIPDNGENSVV